MNSEELSLESANAQLLDAGIGLVILEVAEGYALSDPTSAIESAKRHESIRECLEAAIGGEQPIPGSGFKIVTQYITN